MQRVARRWLRIIVVIAVILPSVSEAGQITVFAASSLRDVLTDIAADYETNTGDTVVLVFAASSAIARQVALGAPADAVILADDAWASWLIEQNAVTAMTPIASNRLVLVGRDAVDGTFPDFIGDDLIALAQVDAVPAGRYAKAALHSLGLWGALEGQIIQGDNVRAALRFVQRGEVDFGIGYASDLVALPDLVELYGFAPQTHVPIVYAGGAVTDGGQDFMSYTQSVAAQSSFKTWGFLPRPDPS